MTLPSMRSLTAAVLLASGCSMHQKSPFARPGETSVVTVDPAEVASARDAPEPEVRASTHVAAGRLFQSNRQFTKAMEQYRRAIALDPNNVEAHHLLGVLAGYLGHHGEAEAALRRALQIDPGASTLRNNLGFEYIVQRRWHEAEREFRRAISIDPHFDRAYVNLGLALAAQGRFEEAFNQFRWVLPEPDAYYDLGLTYAAAKRYDEARAAFEKVLAIDPSFEAARRQVDLLPPAPGQGTAGPADRAEVAAFKLDDSFIDTVTRADWTGIRKTLGRSPERDRDTDRVTDPACLGDFDGDGRVDRSDSAEFNACFFKHEPVVAQGCERADFDQDGDVDLLDYLQFQRAFGRP